MRSLIRFLQTASQKVWSCAKLAVGRIIGVLGFSLCVEPGNVWCSMLNGADG
jgi:hypothetical protein